MDWSDILYFSSHRPGLMATFLSAGEIEMLKLMLRLGFCFIANPANSSAFPLLFLSYENKSTKNFAISSVDPTYELIFCQKFDFVVAGLMKLSQIFQGTKGQKTP